MTRVVLVLLLMLIAALPIAAQDLAVTLTLDKTVAYTGERVGGTVTVKNKTGIAANAVSVDLGFDSFQQGSTFDAPAGWSCGVPGATVVARCSVPAFAPNAEVTARFTVLLRNDLSSPTLRLQASATSYAFADPTIDDNYAVANLEIVAHPTVADLSVGVTARQNPVPPGTPALIDVDIRNDGPAPANHVLLRTLWSGTNEVPALAGAGWTCTGFHCTRPFLGSGESAPITATITSPWGALISIHAEAGAEESFDPSSARADLLLGVGEAVSWQRILLPVALLETPGANGSLWRTDVTGYLHSGLVEVDPRFCFRSQCPPLPIGRPFDLLAAKVAPPHPRLPSSFVFLRAADGKSLTLNLRVRDLTRTAETWGTEMPAVYDTEFRTSPIVLMPLPVDPLFRTTLRVYDLDARPGATVAIQVYADQEETPRATLVRTLATVPDTYTTALLPMYPGYLQIDALAEAGTALAGAKTAWLRVEPRTPGLRFWTFASVTNNPTGHVTTVTP
jgi:hypothetical protein